jgi:glucose/arabinose dehydrogenase
MSGANRYVASFTPISRNLVVARCRRGRRPRVDPASAAVLLTIPFPANAARYGGALAFGRDGYLYVGTGDGGSPNDMSCTAQRADSLLGKILRLDVNVNTSKEPFYGIPLTNPFARSGGALEKIWAKGLRDPRRLSFDRATGGKAHQAEFIMLKDGGILLEGNATELREAAAKDAYIASFLS